jgi:hypothetical protein
MEFEDHYVTSSLKNTMGHWLWCAVLSIEVFGLFWYKTLTRKLKGCGHLEDLGIDGRKISKEIIRYRVEDLNEINLVVALVNSVMNL